MTREGEREAAGGRLRRGRLARLGLRLRPGLRLWLWLGLRQRRWLSGLLRLPRCGTDLARLGLGARRLPGWRLTIARLTISRAGLAVARLAVARWLVGVIGLGRLILPLATADDDAGKHQD